jgi:aminopeptidase N
LTSIRLASLIVVMSLSRVADAQAQATPEGGVPSTPADRYQRQPALDVLHYEIGVELPAEGVSVTGRTAVLYQAVGDALADVRLDLGAAMVVDSVSIDGAAVGFERAGDGLTIHAPATPAGTRREAVVRYHGEPSDGLIIGQSRHGGRAIFADNWADRAHQWFPSVDHPSDKATVELEVTAPAGLEVVGNGIMAERIELGDGRARTRWVESAGIPVYGMVIGAADFAIERAGVVEGVEVSHWTFPEDSAAGAVAFSRSTEILAFYDSLLGPYPYEKLAHVQSATKFGGMENPGAIFYGQRAIGAALGLDPAGREELTGTVAHETVHQWFGDAVTEGDWNHLWLSEGFAEYFDAVFFEFHGGIHGRGPTELARQMRKRADAVRELEAGGPRAIYAPGAGPGAYETLLNAENYEKGAWILHMLRGLVGDAAFFDGVRDYYATLRDGTAWTSDFVRVMEESSGRPLDWFFSQWVARPGMPALRASIVDAGGPRRLRIDQVQPGAPYRLDFEVELRGTDGTERRRVEMEGASVEIPLAGEGRVEPVLDPDGWLLFRDAP